MIKYFFVFLLTLSSLFALDGLVIQAKDDAFVHFKLGLHEDTSSKQTFEEIRSLQTFVSHSNSISTGYSQSAFWIVMLSHPMVRIRSNTKG